MDELMKQAEDHLAKGRVQITTDEAVLGIIAKLDHAMDVVSEISQGKRNWTMSVPARPDSDPDLVISAALRDAKAALSSNAAKSAGQEPVAIDEVQELLKKISYSIKGDCYLGQDEEIKLIDKVLELCAKTWQQEPLFWYRPVCDGEMYEGPIHNNSATGKILRDAKPEEWKPLYTHPSSAAQVEEIRNADSARMDFIENRGFFHAGKATRLKEATRKNVDEAIRALKTAAPSKGKQNG